MSLVKISDSFIRASDGTVVPPGTPCYVYLRGTQTLAALKTSIGETTPNPAPITGGLLEAYVQAPASYDLTVTVDGVTKTQPYEAFLATEVSSGSVTVFTHIQTEVAATWTFTHTLGHVPASVDLYDSEGNRFDAAISCPDIEHVVVTMEPGLGCSGKAVLI